MVKTLDLLNQIPAWKRYRATRDVSAPSIPTKSQNFQTCPASSKDTFAFLDPSAKRVLGRAFCRDYSSSARLIEQFITSCFITVSIAFRKGIHVVIWKKRQHMNDTIVIESIEWYGHTSTHNSPFMPSSQGTLLGLSLELETEGEGRTFVCHRSWTRTHLQGSQRQPS